MPPQINSDPSNAGPDPSSTPSMQIGIRRPSGEGGAIIPGPAQPTFLRRNNLPADRPIGPVRFVRMLKGRLVGDRFVNSGEVVQVSEQPVDPRTGRLAQINIMPAWPMLLQDRAQKMVERGEAEPHAGPATVELGHSLDVDKVVKAAAGETVEQQTLQPRVDRAERTVAVPQRRGAM